MSQQLNEIKKRMQGVSSTKKLTHASEMVASVKLSKYKTLLNNYSNYNTYVDDVLKQVLYRQRVKNEDSLYLLNSNKNNPVHIVCSGNNGLCGNFHEEMFNYLKNNLSKDEAIVAIGSQVINFLKKENYLLIDEYDDIDDFDLDKLQAINDMLISLYRHEEISSLDLIYTRHINSLKSENVTLKLLPLQLDEEYFDKDILLEPERKMLLNEIVPFSIYSKIVCAYLSNKTAEYAARKNAMNAASKNAEKLEASLRLEYNKARQQAITQEVNEIVGANN